MARENARIRFFFSDDFHWRGKIRALIVFGRFSLPREIARSDLSLSDDALSFGRGLLSAGAVTRTIPAVIN